MKRSFGYSLVRLILKLKGEKKSWSVNPIDYLKKRKQDIHSPHQLLLLGTTSEPKEVHNSKVTMIKPKKRSRNALILYCHGGAFVYGPIRENWVAIGKIVKQTGTDAWMVDYPKAPENKIDSITESIYQVYQEAANLYGAPNIILMGDSAGGNLIISLSQRLSKEKNPLPNRLIAITPVIDASMTNNKIPQLDEIDPLLSLNGVLSANIMCAGNLSLKDPMISPLYGEDLGNLPPIHLFMATDDILAPDQEEFAQRVKEEGGSIDIIVGEQMPHVWPIFPIMPEARKGLKQIISIINKGLHER